MTDCKYSAEEWARDIEARQRNVIFPDTAQNEARFWRNLGGQPWTPVTRAGVVILGIFVFGFIGRLLVAAFQERAAVRAVLVVVSIWGPIFLAIAWATRRALRGMKDSKRK